MPVQLRLKDLHNACQSEDPELAAMIVALAVQGDPEPETPIREGAPTFEKFIAEIRSPEFRQKPKEDQARYRTEQMAALESPDAEVPLSDRLRLHEIIQALWENNGPFARNCLLDVIADIRLTYGPWRALKNIAKQAEQKNDTEILGALAARFDMAYADANHDIGVNTLGYMCRRLWRYLRYLGQSFPVGYADSASDFLARYTDNTVWKNTWVANHILFHNTGKYSRRRFICYQTSPADMLKNRAYPKLWQRSFRPLLSLLEQAQSRRVQNFAVAALKKDFRAQIRDIEPFWVARLISGGQEITDEFVIWLLSNVPRFEQSALKDLGLHEPVLKLFDSGCSKARIYAAEYARVHARDLPVDDLVRLLNNKESAVRNLAKDLIRERDPRKDVGLDAWGLLLETEYGHEFAAKMLSKHFTARDLTPEWFKERILSGRQKTFDFAVRVLPQVHSHGKLGTGFFCDILHELEKTPDILSPNIAGFAFNELARFDSNKLDPGFLRRVFIHPEFNGFIRFWIEEGRLAPATLGVDYFKTLSYHPDWDKSKWVADLKKSGLEWTKDLHFNEEIAEFSMGLLKDVRVFSANELGFDWLMQLAGRSESRYHKFAVSVMVRSFVPADFAETDASPEKETAPAETAGEVTTDFLKASFLFTGKLATMTRKQAQEKVTKANGKNASGVTANLDYLVIGDEGSSLYGQGRKGSKQIKAEQLIEKGADIRIISETAFLKMLAGKQVEVSGDAQVKGCERLWNMVTALGEDEDLFRQFAITYILGHHPGICLAETDRPVDPGAEIPEAFLEINRIMPLFSDQRKSLRNFALKLAQWEFARWSPESSDLVRLCNVPNEEVRQFTVRALTADDIPEHRRYRVDAGKLGTDAVIQFCESSYADIRQLGMALIRRHPEYQEPEALFSLTESPDRQIRAFAVRNLWMLYRDKGITPHWLPKQEPTTEPPAKKKKQEKKKQETPALAGPMKKPELLPASHERIKDLLRRILFEISPGRFEKAGAVIPEDLPRLSPLSSRKAKLSLVETLRDLSIENMELAEAVFPILHEFMQSKGPSEQAACLVAVVRIQRTYPHLAGGTINII